MKHDLYIPTAESRPEPTPEVRRMYDEIREDQGRISVGRLVRVQRGLAKDQQPFEGTVNQVEQRAYGLRVVLKVQGRRRKVVVCGDQCHVPAARSRA